MKLIVKIPLLRPILLLLVFLLIEVVLAGAGRFFTFGPLTLKMYLFFMTTFLAVVSIVLYPLVDRMLGCLVSFFTLTLLVGVVIGVVNDASILYMLTDLKPLMYFYILLFFFISVRSFFDIRVITKIIKISALTLAVAYLIILSLLLLKIIDFNWFYEVVSKPSFYDEIGFRGNKGCFFYKGFIFLVIGFIFYFFQENSRARTLSLFIFLIAILGTQTRGFIVDLIAVIIFWFVFINKLRIHKNVVKWFILGVPVCIILFFIYYQAVIGDRTESDLIRYLQMEQVWERITPVSFFFGHGFGIGVPIRDVHMEITYLEIFHKQGLFGLIFWMYFLYLPTTYFFQIKKISEKKAEEILPYYLSVIAIYVQSLTNPYLINPIGLSICLLAIVVLRVVVINLKVDTNNSKV